MSENQDIRWVFQFLGDYGQHDSSFHRNILILSYSSKNYGSGKGTLPSSKKNYHDSWVHVSR